MKTIGLSVATNKTSVELSRGSEVVVGLLDGMPVGLKIGSVLLGAMVVDSKVDDGF